MKNILLSTLLAIGLDGSASAQLATTDTFGTGANQFSLDFRTIGNAGNAADTTGYGSVGYTYRMGTYAISGDQVFKATSSGLIGVGSSAMSPDQPASYISWIECAAFVNWLNISKGFEPAYNLIFNGQWSFDLWTVDDIGYDSKNRYRNSLAKYFLPSENEFYKAAYGKSDGSGYYLYPTASDTPPTAVASGTEAGTAVYNSHFPNFNNIQTASVYEAGGLSSYGTMGQGGNISQLLESAYDGKNNSIIEYRTQRGGNFAFTVDQLQSSSRDFVSAGYDGKDEGIGFRVASVDIGSIPEPSTYALFGIGAIAMLMVLRRKKAV